MLTSGQTILLPNSTTDIAARPKRRAVVCLFGPPDPVETERLYLEQMLIDQIRFFTRFQPILESEMSEDRTTDYNSSSSEDRVESRLEVQEDVGRHRESNQEPPVRRGRVERPKKQRKQAKLTDFYQKTRNYAKAEPLQKDKDDA